MPKRLRAGRRDLAIAVLKYFYQYLIPLGLVISNFFTQLAVEPKIENIISSEQNYNPQLKATAPQ